MQIEEKIKRLEEITQLLEQGEQTLEKSIELYEEGTILSKECKEYLDTIEQKVTTLNNN